MEKEPLAETSTTFDDLHFTEKASTDDLKVNSVRSSMTVLKLLQQTKIQMWLQTPTKTPEPLQRGTNHYVESVCDEYQELQQNAQTQCSEKLGTSYKTSLWLSPGDSSPRRKIFKS